MAIDNNRKEMLRQAIYDYDFPFVTFNFADARETRYSSMRQVETEIRGQLLSDTPDSIKDGFSNVLYWGYARTGYRWARINDFRNKATTEKLSQAGETLRGLSRSDVRQIAKLKLPQFSGLSFISKVRMFLDPANYVVLDLQLLKLRGQGQPNLFDAITSAAKTSIAVTKRNETIYEQWCGYCRQVAAREFGGIDVRAVDVERGVFHLIQTGRAHLAAEIVANL